MTPFRGTHHGMGRGTRNRSPPPQWGPWVGTTRAREATQEAPVRTPAEPALTRPRVSAFVGPLIPKAGQIPVDHTGYAARPTCPSQRLLSQQPPIPKPRKGVPRSLQKPLPRGAVGDRPGLGGAQQGGQALGLRQTPGQTERWGRKHVHKSAVHGGRPTPPLAAPNLSPSTGLPCRSWEQRQGPGRPGRQRRTNCLPQPSPRSHALARHVLQDPLWPAVPLLQEQSFDHW